MGKRSPANTVRTRAVRPSILGLALFVGIAANLMTGMALTGQSFTSLSQLNDLVVIDDGDAGYTEDKSVQVQFSRAHAGDFRYMVREASQTDDTAPRATWNFTNLEPGTYEVYATWVPFGSNNPIAEYVVEETGTRLSSLTVDQRGALLDATFNGVNWKRIGEFSVSGTELAVSMRAGVRFSIVDAIGIRKITTGAQSHAAAPVTINIPAASLPVATSSAPAVQTAPRVTPAFIPAQSSRSSARSSSAPVVPAVTVDLTPVAAQDFRAAVCGNAFVDRGEECDDGNFRPGDGCSLTCKKEFCGDGMVSSGEECDSGQSLSLNGARTQARCGVSCRWEYCGDGIVQEQLGEYCDDQNTIDKDGCSSTCRQTEPSNPHGATLAVTQKSIGTAESVVSGTKNVALQRFEVRAGDKGSIVLNTLQFYAGAGAVNAENYSLVVDTNNDGTTDRTVQTNVTPDANGFITFNVAPHIISRNLTIVMEVHADITAAPLTDSLSLTFASGENVVTALEGSTNSILSGISLNGVCAAGSCTIFLTTAPSKTFTIKPQGSLFLINGDENSTDGTLSVRMRALDEGITVTSLQITSLGNDASSVERLELFKTGEQTPFAIATVSNCGSKEVPKMVNGTAVQTFCATMNNRELVVFANQETSIVIRPRIKELINPADIQQLRFFIASTPASDELTGRGAVHATGLVSGMRLRANDGDSVAHGEIFIGTATPTLNQDITGNN